MVEVAHDLLTGGSGADPDEADDVDFLEQALVLVEQLGPTSVGGEGEEEGEGESGSEGAGGGEEEGGSAEDGEREAA